METTFKILSAIDCSEYTEKKGNLTYLSWAWAWGITKKHFPDANYEVVMFDGKPYLFDEHLGYLVMTKVTIDGETIGMQLPIMDGSNKAQKHVAYTYKTKYGEKSVEPATMFDINTAIMRCLTKNLAMFGLGHYIYAGEDLPKVEAAEPEPAKTANIQEVPADLQALIIQKVVDCETLEDLGALSKTVEGKKALGYPSLKQLFTARKIVIENGNK